MSAFFFSRCVSLGLSTMTLLVVASTNSCDHHLYHRRPRASVAGVSSPRQQHLVLPNGGGDHGEDSNHYNNNNNDDDESKRKTNKKHRRRRQNRSDNDNHDHDNVSFFKLFLQTGITLAVICFIIWNIYRHYYPYVAVVEDIFTDDDDFNMDAGEQQQQQLPETAKDNVGRGGGGGRVGSDFVAQDNTLQAPPKKLLQEIHLDPPMPEERTTTTTTTTIPPLPVWNLTTSIVDYDAFGIAQRYGPSTSSLNTNNNTDHLTRFWLTAQKLRHEFAKNYGGENAARALLERGMSTFSKRSVPISTITSDSDGGSTHYIPTDLWHTTCRIQRALKHEHRPFVFAFGGYSVTVGRGNYFTQSYPFVMERQLSEVFQFLQALFGNNDIDATTTIPALQVHNAAIGGCPSFPYGWCMRNFFGLQPDVISWDFSMNEQGPDGLQAYIRHTLSSAFPDPPKLIIKDTHMATERQQILQKYVQLAEQQHQQQQQMPSSSSLLLFHHLYDPVVLHSDPATEPFLSIIPEENRPIGFREWRKFGGPPGGPGQALHHPAVKEHEMLAWMLSMHFLAALQLVAAAAASTNGNAALNLNCPAPAPLGQQQQQQHGGGFLPPPFVDPGVNTNTNYTKPWSSIMYGQPVQRNNNISNVNSSLSSSPQQQVWRMNPIYCRTTFEPIVTGDLQDIVAWGGVAEDVDVMLPKSKMYYNRGWVLDLSESEKKAKRNLKVHDVGSSGGNGNDNHHGFGFIDSKKAYYGLVTSHVLSLFLPYQQQQQQQPHQQEKSNPISSLSVPKIGDKAFDWFQSVVICQVNEKDRPTGACDLTKADDVQVVVGGVNTTGIAMDAVGTRYLGKQLCLYLPVVNDASCALTSRKLLVQKAQGNVTQKYIFPEDEEVDKNISVDKDETAVGLAVEVHVINQHIVQREQACSVSHIVWEQQQHQQLQPAVAAPNEKQLQQQLLETTAKAE